MTRLSQTLLLALTLAVTGLLNANIGMAQSAQALFEKGFSLFKSDPRTAEQLIRTGLGKEPGNYLGHYYLAEILIMRNNVSAEALEHYQRAAQLSPESTEGLDALAKSMRLKAKIEAPLNDRLYIMHSLKQLYMHAYYRQTGMRMHTAAWGDWTSYSLDCLALTDFDFHWDPNTINITEQRTEFGLRSIVLADQQHGVVRRIVRSDVYLARASWNPYNVAGANYLTEQILNFEVDEYPKTGNPDSGNQNFVAHNISLRKLGDKIFVYSGGDLLLPATGGECD